MNSEGGDRIGTGDRRRRWRARLEDLPDCLIGQVVSHDTKTGLVNAIREAPQYLKAYEIGGRLLRDTHRINKSNPQRVVHKNRLVGYRDGRAQHWQLIEQHSPVSIKVERDRWRGRLSDGN